MYFKLNLRMRLTEGSENRSQRRLTFFPVSTLLLSSLCDFDFFFLRSLSFSLCFRLLLSRLRLRDRERDSFLDRRCVWRSSLEDEDDGDDESLEVDLRW